MNIRKYQTDFSRDLAIKYNSPNTRNTYFALVKKFLEHFREEVEPKAINNSKIKDYLLGFQTLNTRKQNLCAIRAFYELTVNMPEKVKRIPYPKKQKKLPRVIDRTKLLQKITRIKNLKHKAIISLGFSVGLRVSEVINLQISDIDSTRMLILVRNAKGGKDRYVPLSEKILLLLREYFKYFHPKKFLFNGQNNSQYTPSSCNAIVKKHLGSDCHFHLLRHSCFTAMLEAGTDIRIIQKIAGHNSSKTTEVYTHVSKQFLSGVPTPI